MSSPSPPPVRSGGTKHGTGRSRRPSARSPWSCGGAPIDRCATTVPRSVQEGARAMLVNLFGLLSPTSARFAPDVSGSSAVGVTVHAVDETDGLGRRRSHRRREAVFASPDYPRPTRRPVLPEPAHLAALGAAVRASRRRPSPARRRAVLGLPRLPAAWIPALSTPTGLVLRALPPGTLSGISVGSLFTFPCPSM